MNAIRRLLALTLSLSLIACAAETPATLTATEEAMPSPSPTQESTQESTSTPVPSPTIVPESPFSLRKVGDQVQAYPGPLHYAGDVLTFEVPVEGFSSDLLVDEAIKFVTKHRSQPFFLYVPFIEPHFLIEAPEEA